MDFFLRTEDIQHDEVLELFVENDIDREVVNLLKSPSPTIIEGSRGTGKSFLMTVAHVELLESFESERVLPIYMGFMGSSLLHSRDLLQFRHWMIAKVVKHVLKQLQKSGLASIAFTSPLIRSIGQPEGVSVEKKMDEIIKSYENSFRTPGQDIDASGVPDVDDLKDALESVCKDLQLKRVCLFFDEAAHVFRPEQQRQFFSLFRDLRSPYISCNAAVYPGVTHYGNDFEINHDAVFRRIERDVLEANYLDTMQKMVLNQAKPDLKKKIKEHKDYFNTLALAASGNPRVLFKTILKSAKMSMVEIDKTIKDYYRADIWTEHTLLGEKYTGHRAIIDWGRTFIEDYVIPETVQKNLNPSREEREEKTIYFWLHKDAPAVVKEALRLLSYTGIIRKLDDGVKGTRSQIGSRYEIKYGCVLALEINPVKASPDLKQKLSIKRFTSYGQNHPFYSRISLANLVNEEDSELAEKIKLQLTQPISVLDLTLWQINKLKEAGIMTIEALLSSEENSLIDKIRGVGSVKARTMKNAASAELLEYLSG